MIKNPTEHQKEKTFVYFIRHGDRIHIPGRKDIGLEIPGPGLSNLGVKQAKLVAKELLKIKDEIDVIYSSSMARAIETAKEISHLVHKKPIIIPELCEFSKSLWNKKIYTKKFWQDLKRYNSAKKAFDKILEKNKGKVIVIVAHGGVINGIFGKKFGLKFKKINNLDYGNCHITLLRFKGKKLDYVHCFNSKTI